MLFLFCFQGRPGVRSQRREGAAAEPTEGAAERTRQQHRAAHTTAAAAGPADGQMHCCFRHKTNHFKSIKTSNYTQPKQESSFCIIVLITYDCFNLEHSTFVCTGAAWSSTGEETAAAAVWGAGTGSAGDGPSSQPVRLLHSLFLDNDRSHLTSLELLYGRIEFVS